jgi:hypothetical protein
VQFLLPYQRCLCNVNYLTIQNVISGSVRRDVTAWRAPSFTILILSTFNTEAFDLFVQISRFPLPPGRVLIIITIIKHADAMSNDHRLCEPSHAFSCYYESARHGGFN